MKLAMKNIEYVTVLTCNEMSYSWMVVLKSHYISDMRNYVNYENGVTVVKEYKKEWLPKTVQKFLECATKELKNVQIIGDDEYALWKFDRNVKGEKKMEKLTFREFENIMFEYGKTHHNNEDYKEAITGVIVYKESAFDRPYTEIQRSYRVSSCNRCFQGGKISNAMVGSCLDGTDQGVRLDWYKWEIDYCYMEN